MSMKKTRFKYFFSVLVVCFGMLNWLSIAASQPTEKVYISEAGATDILAELGQLSTNQLEQVVPMMSATPYTATETATATAEPAYTATATATTEPAYTATATATTEPAYTATATATMSPTATMEPTYTPTMSPTATMEPTYTPTMTPTTTPIYTPTMTSTATPIYTPTMTPTVAPTYTATMTPTVAPTYTATMAPTVAPTYTATPTTVPTYTATATPTTVPTYTATATPTPTPTGPVYLMLNPRNQRVSVSETFTITVDASRLDNLGGFEFSLSYDPALVEFGSASLGDFVEGAEREFSALGPDDQNGVVTYGASSLGDSNGPSGEGRLASLTFVGIAAGSSSIELTGTQVTDVAALVQEVGQITNAQVSVVPQSIDVEASASEETIDVSWGLQAPLVGDFDTYQLLRSEKGGDYMVISDTMSTQYTDQDASLQPDTEYCYQIKALDNQGQLIAGSDTACAQLGSLTILVPDQVVPVDGENVPVTISLANGNGLCTRALDIKLSYDDTIVQASGTVSPTIYTEGYMSIANTSVSGEIKIVAFAESSQCVNLYGPGSLFDVYFDVTGNADEVSPISFIEGLTGTVIYDADNLDTPVPLTLQDGSLTVGERYVRGDVNGDAKVDGADAAFVLDITNYVVMPSSEEQTACDINGDGNCNAADSSLILCYLEQQDWNQCASTNNANQFRRTQNADPVAVEVGSIEESDTTVTATVVISNATDLAGMHFGFTYDASQMSVTDVSTTSLTSEFEIDFSDEEPGLLHVSMASDSPIGADGAILMLVFTKTLGISSIDIADIRLNDAAGRDFENSVLQRTIEVVPHNIDNRLYLPLVMN